MTPSLSLCYRCQWAAVYHTQASFWCFHLKFPGYRFTVHRAAASGTMSMSVPTLGYLCHRAKPCSWLHPFVEHKIHSKPNAVWNTNVPTVFPLINMRSYAISLGADASGHHFACHRERGPASHMSYSTRFSMEQKSAWSHSWHQRTQFEHVPFLCSF